MKRLFENYYNDFSAIASKKASLESFSGDFKAPRYFEKGFLNEEKRIFVENNSQNKVLTEFDSNQLVELFGRNASSFQNSKIGTHPDFEDLEYHEFTNHFCVSMFIDIKGSTRLVEKYTLQEIRRLKDTVLTLAIRVASHFGGHIHRLQGDGVFIQFVRKNQLPQDAVINALNCASILTHFISKDLADVLEANETKPLGVRTGIDLGFKDDVLWSHYGIIGCSELTTTSLHTDLASKLQSNAAKNEIFIGGNVKDVLDIKSDFAKDVIKNSVVDYYIYKGIKNYRKFNFNWFEYLKSFDFTRVSSSGGSLDIEIPTTKILCEIQDKNGDNKEIYYQNANAIKKGKTIIYTLKMNGSEYVKRDFESIEWFARNSGKEAKEKNLLEHNFEGLMKNKTQCFTLAGFKGHHYVECIIKREHSLNKRITFPIFVE